jgi:hypothetical protein
MYPEFSVLFIEHVDTIFLNFRTVFNLFEGGQHRW